MERIIRFFVAFTIATTGICANAATARTGRLTKYIDPQSYAYMYPYLNNKMRTELNPGTTVSMANNPMNIVVKTEQMSAPRRVVPRTRTANTTGTARAATQAQPTMQRRVVARTPATNSARAATATTITARSATRPIARAAGSGTTSTVSEGVSYNRCLADYTQCMEGYCARENTAYNRCYCSAKLAQIDAQYQNQIANLLVQIVKLQSDDEGIWTEEEMNEYWMETVGNNVGTNSWTNLENALNIQWPTTDERIRGQQVFLTGHQYCSQHLRACAPMASNMREAYRSKIARDCQTYENTLIKIKNTAETVIENYGD